MDTTQFKLQSDFYMWLEEHGNEILCSQVQSEFSVEFKQAAELLNEAEKRGIVKEQFGFACSNKECRIRFSTENKVFEKNKMGDSVKCPCCGTVTEYTADNIFISYVKVKKGV